MKRVRGECPLGSKCEVVETRNEEQVLITCPWYKKFQGQDMQGNDHDEWDCSIAWMPMLQIEMAGTNRGQTAAIESMRNETIKRQDAAINAMNKLEDDSRGIINANTQLK